ncbi:SMP-30/gluconolactonase/LRE family protein [Candidatus Latescibacterota bacterium]
MKGVITFKKWFIPVFFLGLNFCVVQLTGAEGIQRGEVQKVAVIPGTGMIDGPAYNPDDGMLYFVEMEAGWISRITPDGKNLERIYNIGKMGGKIGPKSMVWDRKRKKLLILDRDFGILALDPKTKELITLIDTYQGGKFNGPDDLIEDSEGNIYFTDPWGTSVSNPDGAVYRVVGEGLGRKIIKLMDNLAFPDGILISPDESFIYVGELGTNRILRAFLIDGGRDTLFPHVFIYFDTAGGPDGMAMDVKGNLYVAHWGAGKVYVVEPQKGQIIDEIEIPDPEGVFTTNVAFGGPDNKTLFITESAKRTIWKVGVTNPGMTIPPEK